MTQFDLKTPTVTSVAGVTTAEVATTEVTTTESTLSAWESALSSSLLDALGHRIDQQLQAQQVGLMMGGEPTFVARDQLHLAQWQTVALGPEKRSLAERLLWELCDRLQIPHALRHSGIGKQYPGEGEPRWSLGCYWRQDGQPLWRDTRWLAKPSGSAPEPEITENQVQSDLSRLFMEALVQSLGIAPQRIIAAYEAEAETPTGYVLPLLAVVPPSQAIDSACWASCSWTFAPAYRPQPETADPFTGVVLLATTGPVGLRLPLHGLPEVETWVDEVDAALTAAPIASAPTPVALPDNSIRIALAVELRADELCVFLPPLSSARGFVDLLAQVEAIATRLQVPVRIEGYVPPRSSGIEGFQITPDPGVIEVNIHPAATWAELSQISNALYGAATACGLMAYKYANDGRLIPTGGGSHITLGGVSTQTSPLLRRPDLLRSFISYWQNHPSLSYLFAGLFVGPTSQAPRVDEARHETLYELEIAFQAIQSHQSLEPAVLDRLLGNLLIDVTGNTHRAAFCIDKLFPVNNPRLQLGLLEFRFFAMPPLAWMQLLELLLIRAFVAWFWQHPYTQTLQRWGTTLHDRFFLPYYIAQDFQGVLADLRSAGYDFDWTWFEPLLDFRFPLYGCLEIPLDSGPPLSLELRHALEIWPVLGEDASTGNTSRAVDSSMERLQVMLRGGSSEHQVLCNGQCVPLVPVENAQVENAQAWVGGVRFRARRLGSMLNPFVDPHAPLRFEVVDRSTQTVLGVCFYHADGPSGEPYWTIPQDEAEARSRRQASFHTGEITELFRSIPPLKQHSEYPLSLDLRWQD